MHDIEITGDLMTSKRTHHTARRDGDVWYVSWLPNKPVNKGLAINALVLAGQITDQEQGRGISERPFQARLLAPCQELGVRIDTVTNLVMGR